MSKAYVVTYQKDDLQPGNMLSWPGPFRMLDYDWLEKQLRPLIPEEMDFGPIAAALQELHRRELARIDKTRSEYDNNKWVRIPYNDNPKLPDSYINEYLSEAGVE